MSGRVRNKTVESCFSCGQMISSHINHKTHIDSNCSCIVTDVVIPTNTESLSKKNYIMLYHSSFTHEYSKNVIREHCFCDVFVVVVVHHY